LGTITGFSGGSMNFRLSALSIAILAAAVVPSAALAQNTDRVEVTGTLIKRLASEAALPVTTISGAELAASGVTNAEQAVKLITQQQGGTVTSASVSGTNGAAAYASLRNLGAGRTLVLLNGRRVVNNPFSAAAVDLNSLPTAVIERVEVLADGASAIYGTDAIAGVINFITKSTYNKTAIEAQAQVTQHGGGDVYNGAVTTGFGDVSKRWNVFGSLSIRDAKPMLGTERDFSATSYIPAQGFNGLSPTTFPANYSQTGTVTNANPSLAQDCLPPTSLKAPETNGSFIRCFADTQGFTHTIPTQKQQSLFVKGTFALNESHTAGLEFMRSNNMVRTQIAPSPEGGLSVPSSSPFYPIDPRLDRTRPVSVSWRTTVLGPRRGEQENITQRAVASLDGSIAGWDYQSALLASKSNITNTFLGGYPMTQPLRNGTAGLNGAPFLNPFGEQSAAGLAYLQQNQVLGQVQDGQGKLSSFTFSASRPLIRLPGGPLSMALGTEVRKEEMVYNTNIALASQAASSGLAGSGAQRAGDRDVRAAALEFVAPITKHLELGAAVRRDSYSDFGGTTNPKVSFRLQPNEIVVFRGSYNKGFTAPTLADLYAPQATTFTATRYNDPVLCPNGTPTAQAVPSRDCGIQFQRLTGGNPGLTPERSKAWTVGLAVQPFKELTLSADFWRYYVSNAVSTISETAIFSDTAKYGNLFVRCSQAPEARRNAIGACLIPGGDPLAYIINTNLNLGDTRTSGLDVQGTWVGAPSAAGRFTVNARGSYVSQYQFQIEPRGAWFNPVGNYIPQGGPVLRYQQVMTVKWDYQKYSTVISHRWISGYKDQNANSAPFNVAPFNTNVVGSYALINLSVAYTGFKNTTLQGGIVNLLDTDPPFTNQLSRFQARGYDDRFHNPLGRTFQLSAKYEF
jgi:iron complex outermembrane receptor protein